MKERVISKVEFTCEDSTTCSVIFLECLPESEMDMGAKRYNIITKIPGLNTQVQATDYREMATKMFRDTVGTLANLAYNYL